MWLQSNQLPFIDSSILVLTAAKYIAIYILPGYYIINYREYCMKLISHGGILTNIIYVRMCAAIAVLVLILGNIIWLPKVFAAADTCTWSGAINGNWSIGGNWTGCDNGGVPENGDSLVFPTIANNKTNANDLVGLNLGNVIFNGQDYVVTGNAIDISPSFVTVMQFTNTSGNNDFGINTTINGASVAISQDAGSGINEISGDLTYNLTGDMNFYNDDSSGLQITGDRAGSSGNVNYFGNVNVEGTGTNTYAGGINVNPGTAAFSIVSFQSPGAVGAGTPVINVTASTANVDLFLSAGTYSNAINLNGSASNVPELSTNGNVTISGNVNVNTDFAFIKPQSGTLTLSGGFNVNQDVEIEMSPGTDLIKSGASPIAIANNTTVSINSLGSYPGPTVTVSSLITGSSSTAVNVSGELFLELSSNSTGYDGTFSASNNAILRPLNTNALGSTVSGTTINDSAVLLFTSNVALPENLSVVGTGRPSGSYSGGAIWVQNADPEINGTINLLGDTTFAMEDNDSSGDEFIIGGSITGTGDLTLMREIGVNPTRFNFLQTSPNTYSGKTIIQGATLELNGGAQVIPNDLDINSTPTQSAIVGFASDDDIADDSVITFNDEATPGTFASLQLLSTFFNDTVGTINGNGTVCFNNSSQTLNVGGGNTSGSFSGFLCSTGTDIGVINKVGNGSWELASGSAYESATNAPSIDVEAGTLVVNSSFSATTTNIYFGATIKGNGTVGNLSLQPGKLEPGNSPGCFTSDQLSLVGGSNFSVELAGNAACTGYDRANANNVTISGAVTLNVVPSYQPAVGTVFTILQADSISGTFNGLPNGAKFTVNGLEFQINYSDTQVNLTMLGGTLAPTGINTQILSLIAAMLLSFSAVGIYLQRRGKLTKFLRI